MLLNEIMDSDTIFRVDTQSSDILRIVFTVQDTEFTFTAQETSDSPNKWFIDVTPQKTDKSDSKLGTMDTFKVFAGVKRCVQKLLADYAHIDTIVFGTRDSTFASLLNKIMQRNPFPGWKTAGEKNGWFTLTKES